MPKKVPSRITKEESEKLIKLYQLVMSADLYDKKFAFLEVLNTLNIVWDFDSKGIYFPDYRVWEFYLDEAR